MSCVLLHNRFSVPATTDLRLLILRSNSNREIIVYSLAPKKHNRKEKEKQKCSVMMTFCRVAVFHLEKSVRKHSWKIYFVIKMEIPIRMLSWKFTKVFHNN